MDKEKKEVGAWWIWILFLVLITTAVLGLGSYFGLIGKTVVERVVFENSFQYSEARKAEELTFEASLAQIDILLASPDIDEEQRRNLESQRAGINILLYKARNSK